MTQYQVLVQQSSERHFVASIVGLSNVIADGQTEEEAISNVKAALSSQLTGAKMVTIEVEPSHDTSFNLRSKNISTHSRDDESNPWVKYLGVFADDPTWEEFQAEIETYRKEVDEKTNR